MKKAESCIRKARLTALQVHFLSMNLIVLNLNSQAVTKFIVSHPKFWEVCESLDLNIRSSNKSFLLSFIIIFSGHII